MSENTQAWHSIDYAPHDRRILAKSESGEIYAAHWVCDPFSGDEAYCVSEGPDGTQHLVRPVEWREIEISVNDELPKLLADLSHIAELLHYPQCWDTAAYPNIYSAMIEAAGTAGCSGCRPEQVRVLSEALITAHDHIDMEALRISHCKDAETIIAALAAVREPAGSAPLYALYVPGPDDLYAMPSKEVAEICAAKHNASIAEYLERNTLREHSPSRESIMTKVVTWEGSAEDHAEALTEFKAEEWGIGSPAGEGGEA